MKGALDYLLLPDEVTPFEAAYLARHNRLWLQFFWCHLPVFALTAFLCSSPTSAANLRRPLDAVWMTALVLAGPTLVYSLLRNPRTLSLLYGVVAMSMGGLLVHFGQGRMTIEMHFYFFVLVALLSVFGKPLVILTAALTATVHHFVVGLLWPSSVFNDVNSGVGRKRLGDATAARVRPQRGVGPARCPRHRPESGRDQHLPSWLR